MKQSKQESGTGLSPENKENPSSPTSPTKKTKPSVTLESATDQLTSGSISEIQMNGSENGSASGEGLIPRKQKKSKSAMPPPKLGSLEQRTSQALRRLKVKPEVLATAPQITPLLKTTVKGGLKAALNAMRFATDDNEIRAFLKVYDKVPTGDRERLSWEAICIAAKVKPKELLGAIQLAVQAHCWDRSRFIAISNHPDVMEKRVEYAKMAGGERDRTQLDISLGFLPAQKAPTFIGKQVAVFNNNRGGGAPAKDDDDDSKTIQAPSTSSDEFDQLFPSPSDIQEKLVPIRQRLLEG